MNKSVLLAALALFATQAGLAGSCPAVKSFTNIGIRHVVKRGESEWYGVEWNNKFDTENEWTLVVGPFKASSVSGALASANSIVGAMIFRHARTIGEITTCEYTDATNVFSVSALTPPSFPVMSIG